MPEYRLPLRDTRGVLYFDIKSLRVCLGPAVEAWCKDHISQWRLQNETYFECSIFFETAADMIAFKLRWLC